MAAPANPPLPGSMTVPLWYGWQVILVVLLVAALGAVVFFLLSASGANANEKAEWQRFLAARSTSGDDAELRS